MKLNQYTRYTFESISEFGHAVETAPDRINGDASTNSGVDNVFSLDDAIDIAANQGGYWPEGAEGIASVAIDATTATMALKRALKLDVVGAIPNIPAYLAGHPLTMISVTQDPRPKKFLKLGVHIGGTADTRQTTRLNRGKAIMSIVEALETEGYSVEVWGLWRNFDTWSNTAASVEVCLKQASAVWNSHTAAFALANTSFQRRLCWRFIESSDSNAMADSYGNGRKAPHADFDLWFPYITGDIEKSLGTPKKALAYAVSIAKQALQK